MLINYLYLSFLKHAFFPLVQDDEDHENIVSKAKVFFLLIFFLAEVYLF